MSATDFNAIVCSVYPFNIINIRNAFRLLIRPFYYEL